MLVYFYRSDKAHWINTFFLQSSNRIMGDVALKGLILLIFKSLIIFVFVDSDRSTPQPVAAKSKTPPGLSLDDLQKAGAKILSAIGAKEKTRRKSGQSDNSQSSETSSSVKNAANASTKAASAGSGASKNIAQSSDLSNTHSTLAASKTAVPSGNRLLSKQMTAPSPGPSVTLDDLRSLLSEPLPATLGLLPIVSSPGPALPKQTAAASTPGKKEAGKTQQQTDMIGSISL